MGLGTTNQSASFQNSELHYSEMCLWHWFLTLCLYFKWGNPSLFLFIFVLFKYKFYRKSVDFSGIWTRIVGVEGEHDDHRPGPYSMSVCYWSLQSNSFLVICSVTRKSPNVAQKWFHQRNDRFWHLYKNCLRIWESFFCEQIFILNKEYMLQCINAVYYPLPPKTDGLEYGRVWQINCRQSL